LSLLSWKRPPSSAKRVLIFNFFAGVIDRGIPLYTEDIAECLRRVGWEPVELRCPAWLRSAPRPIRNTAFVLFEQAVAPAARWWHRCVLTIYPYNSVGLVDAALGRSLLVVHDLISNRRSRPAARYIQATQRVYRKLGGPICAASAHTLAQLRRLEAFRRCKLALWENPFYSFEAALAKRARAKPPADAAGGERALRVLLCSGMGGNKDYGGALKLFVHSHALRDAQLRIVGFGDDAPLARRRVDLLPEGARRRIVVLPRLRLDELVEEFAASDLVWVHSQGEGFGRSVVEGLLSGKPVVATDIGAFRRFVRMGVRLYRDGEFDDVVANALGATSGTKLDSRAYHAPLEAAVSEVMGEHSRSPGGEATSGEPEVASAPASGTGPGNAE